MDGKFGSIEIDTNSTLTELSDTITTIPTIHAFQTKITRVPTLLHFAHDDVRPQPNKLGAIPIIESQISQVKSGIVRPVDSTGSADGDEKGDADHDELMEDAYTLSHYMELKAFKPKTLNQQLCEVCVSGFKDLPNETIEQCLNVMIGDVPYKWTCVEEVDLKIVFVRFINEELDGAAAEIHQFLKCDGVLANDMTLKLAVEKNTKQLVKDTMGRKKGKNVDIDAVSQEIIKVLERSKTRRPAMTVNEMDYTVDESELRDIPPEILPQLKKDIKEFRLKAIENEKRKREREILEEKKRAKLQLRKLFEKFKEDDGQGGKVDDGDSDEEEEDDGLTDEQYEDLQVKKANQDMLKKFAVKLHSVQSAERKNKDMLADLNELKQYEANLDKSIKEGYATGKFRPSGRNKQREYEADEMDREEAKRDITTKETTDSFLASINIPLKVSLNQDDSEEETPAPSDPNTLTIDEEELDSLLEKIKPKVNSYIEEFLGVEEEELADFVLSIIKDEKNKTKLAEELEEPLGDDAQALTDKIWADISELL
ncbi:hypothetical protein BON22_0054 [Cyberlindnera fabianii]|uniref:U1 small nuclear ribonucleoprotein component SNU71 n=1 Tax=Cyberlindnera fabianii TaxID=36022 RepID=A0A1V2LCW7_CYBFA|nr:hypothetical protein BON22_0054 [Cyberlindnera fabianii]